MTVFRPGLLAAAVVAVLLAATGFSVQVWLLDPPQAAAVGAPEPPLVRTVAPVPGPEIIEFALPARTAPEEEALLFARATGTIAERFVDIGDRVANGQVLATIAAPEIDEAVARARAAVGQAEAREKLASVTLVRGQALVADGHLSRQVLDERRAEADAARADRLAAEAELRRLAEIQRFQVLRAPFAGTIVERRISRGDRVKGDQSDAEDYLFRLARLDALRVQIDAPQTAAMRLRPGMAARVSFAELPGETLSAQVVRAAGLIDPGSGTMRVELALPNPGSRIPAGLNGQVVIEIPRQEPVWLVPTNTVVVRDGKPAAATVDGAGAIRFVPVVLGRNLGDRVEVTGGLSSDSVLVVSPNALLRDGDRVRIEVSQPAAMPRS